MRLRARRHRVTFDPPRAFRVFVDPDKRRNSRWRWKLRAVQRQPPEPYELTITGYCTVTFGEPEQHRTFPIYDVAAR